MTETLDPMAAEVDQKQLAEQLLAQAKEHGVGVDGPERAAQSTRQECPRFGCGDDRAPRATTGTTRPTGAAANSRNGTGRKRSSSRTVPVEIGGDRCPRDIDSSFAPQIVKKRQRRLAGIDEIVLSLSAKGITTGEVSDHFQDVYGATISKDTVFGIADRSVPSSKEVSRNVLAFFEPSERLPAMNSVGHGHRIPRMTVRPSRISPQHTRLRMSEAGNSAI